jgi:hypothetical protein
MIAAGEEQKREKDKEEKCECAVDDLEKSGVERRARLEDGGETVNKIVRVVVFLRSRHGGEWNRVCGMK